MQCNKEKTWLSLHSRSLDPPGGATVSLARGPYDIWPDHYPRNPWARWDDRLFLRDHIIALSPSQAGSCNSKIVIVRGKAAGIRYLDGPQNGAA